MSIAILNKRSSLQKMVKDYPEACIIDVTSKAQDEYMQFSPFYPHGEIPVPFSPGLFSQSVEGIWQGLKVFQYEDIDVTKFEITNMKNIKRSVKKNGMVLGHRKGVKGIELLDYYNARINIYLPAYEWILKFKVLKQLDKIKDLSQKKLVILLDYETNGEIQDVSKPLSHASLIKNYVENNKLKI